MELLENATSDPGALRREAARQLLASGWGFSQTLKQHIGPVLERQHGLEFKDFIALDAIESGSNYPGLVCQRLGMKPSNISRLIEDLVKADLVVRRLDEQDSRRILLTLTDKGRSVLSATRVTMLRLLQRSMSELSTEQVLTFVQTLRQITAHFAEASQDKFTSAQATPTPETESL